MARSSIDIFIEAASESPKIASLVLDAQRIKFESASDEAVRRLHDQVGTNSYKRPASDIHDVANNANVDPGKQPGEEELENIFRSEKLNDSAPGLQSEPAPAAPVDDGLGTAEIDTPDADGIIDNPSDDAIDDFCSMLGGNSET